MEALRPGSSIPAFLNELEEILELTKHQEFHRMQEVLFKRIALCIINPPFWRQRGPTNTLYR